MNNTRGTPPTRHVLRYLRRKLRLGDWIRGHSSPNRSYVEPHWQCCLRLVKKPRCHNGAFSEFDSEIDMPSRRAATFPLADRLPAARRFPHHASSPWCDRIRCGVFGAAGVAIALLAWYPGRWLMLLILLPVIWSATCSRSSALSLWAGYYLTGARDIPRVCERFFAGYGELSASMALELGLVFWLGQAFVLAAPWALLTPRVGGAPRAARTVPRDHVRVASTTGHYRLALSRARRQCSISRLAACGPVVGNVHAGGCGMRSALAGGLDWHRSVYRRFAGCTSRRPPPRSSFRMGGRRHISRKT